jgi:hypothetical protein
MKKLLATLLTLGFLTVAGQAAAGSEWGDPDFDRIYGG